MIVKPTITSMKVSKKISQKGGNNSKRISEKLNKKTILLQFLPKSIEYLESQKTINYKNQKLKTDYLSDIVHNLVLKYYFKKV